MLLVALAMVAIIAMAALSIDVITLYLAREEAQRSADAAALAAARILSISGVTGDPSNSTGGLPSAPWPTACALATQVGQAVATQNTVGSVAATTVNVTFLYNGTTTDCTSAPGGGAFAVNPQVQVQVVRQSLPTFFSRIWSRGASSVSAVATAEAFNSSNSGTFAPSGIVPVQPRCVKPWVVPNLDPLNPVPKSGIYCNEAGGPGACQTLVSTADGSITHPGISLLGASTNGVIGETFWLSPDCRQANSSSCSLHKNTVQPQPNYTGGAGVEPLPNLLYVPGQIGTPVSAIPSCTKSDSYEQAIEGCDAPTNYQCGVKNNNIVDLTRNPGASGDTTNGVQCLIHQTDATNTTSSSGQDYLSDYQAPNSYPFQILAGSGNPLGATLAGNPITSSNSIVSLPIYDNSVNVASGATTNVTFVGFLQVFINAVDQNGNVNVTILNVAGCGNGSTAPGTPVTGSSPVPIRLITPQ
jgi:hypothetical protein